MTKMLSHRFAQSLLNSQHDSVIHVQSKAADNPYPSLSPAILHQQAQQLAMRLLEELGAQRRLVIAMTAGLEFPIAMLACIYAGITQIPVPVPHNKTAMLRIANILKDCQVNTILTSSNVLPVFDQFALPSPSPRPKLLACDTLLNESEISNHDLTFREHPNDVVIIQYTSGSTHHPKGVMLTNENILANGEFSAQRWRFATHKILLSWLPHFHDMGLFGGIIYPLLVDMRAVIIPPNEFIKRPIRWFEAIDHFAAPTISGGPPFAYDLCLASFHNQPLPKLDLSHWEVAFCGADFVPHSLLNRFRNRFAPLGLAPEAVMACYGLAENTLFVGGEPPRHEKSEAELASERVQNGILSEGCYLGSTPADNIKILDLDSHQEVAPGVVGGVYINGPSVTPGYWKQDIEQVQLDEQRWVKTGDLGTIIGQWLYIVGRDKDLIKFNGRNLYPDDIAQTIAPLHPLLNPLAMQLFPSENEDGSYGLVIEKRDNLAIDDLDTLRQNIKLLVYREFGLSLSSIDVLDRGVLPRTTSGKIQRGTAKTYSQAKGAS